MNSLFWGGQPVEARPVAMPDPARLMAGPPLYEPAEDGRQPSALVAFVGAGHRRYALGPGGQWYELRPARS